MPAPKPPTMTDAAVTAVSPILIMAMVGSLVFFLIEVLYGGNYSGRLLWTMFFFVVGTVLIARIMILHGANRALLYGAGLAAATFLALLAFVDYPNLTMRNFAALINAGLMALIWWSANKLTWDCTHIDEDRKNAGLGVLDAATQGEEELKAAPKNATWFEKYLHYRKQRNAKPHTPGVWVLYFSLAALPLFGLGQSLIPAAATDRRRWALILMAVYVGSGLGLLATTTLLGLRKYLRDRGANVPMKMTAGWLGIAAAIIAVFLGLATILPRPHSETPLVNLPKWDKKKERDADKYAQVKDGSKGKGEGAKGETKKDGEKGEGDPEPGGDDAKGEDEKGQGTKGKVKGEQKDGRDGDSKGGEEKQSGSKGSESSQAMGNVAEKAGSFLKWLAWIIIALLVLAAIAFFIVRFLAPFTEWAKNLLDWLKGLRRKTATATSTDEIYVAIKDEPRPPPFSTFRNPVGSQMSVADMVTYSFAAFESWAWEQKLSRSNQETPLEFARRIEKDHGFDGQRLAAVYSQIAYSSKGVPANAESTLREFWSTIHSR